MGAVRMRLGGWWALLLAVGVAAVWPLSAELVNPAVLPAALIAGSALVATAIRPVYGIAIALAAAPLLNSTVTPGPVEVALPGKPIQILVPALAFGVVAYGALLGRPIQHSARSRSLVTAVVAFGGAALLVSVQALEPAESVNKLILIATAIALFLGVREVCRTREDLSVVIAGLLWGVVLMGLQGFFQQAAGTFSEQGFVSGGEVIGRIQGSFGHPNLYGGYLALAIPVGVAVAGSTSFRPALRWLAVVAVAIAVPALYFSYARGAMLGLIAGAAIWLAVTKPRWAVIGGLVLVLGVTTLAPATLRERFDPESSEGDIALRSDIWNAALDIYAENPVLGVGINNFSVAYAELPSTAPGASQRRLLHQDQLLVPPHPQSTYLQALSEGGLVGILALGGLVLASLFAVARTSRSFDPRGRALGAGVGIGLIGVLVHGIVEVPLNTEIMLPLFALLGACSVHLDLDEEPPGEA